MASTNFNLFEIVQPPQNSKWTGAPKLRPKGGSNKTVNIKNDYCWTISPKSARLEIPQIEFEEYELDLSSLITSALYKLRGGIENVQALGQANTEIIKKITGEDVNTVVKSLDASLPSTPTNELNPYAGMYAATKTGFNYVAPYLEELNQGISSRWGDDNPNNTFNSGLGSIVKGFGEKLGSFVDNTNLANIAAPGSYAEKPKFFNPGEPDSYTVRFPLINTYDYKDVVKNWELCYLLTYQNLVNRRSVNLLDPPVLYRVTIPGLRQSPMSYISKLQIQHVGNIRYMDINGMPKPIPEAYMVTITFQDLLMNSRNIFKYALDGQTVIATVAPSQLSTTITGTPNKG